LSELRCRIVRSSEKARKSKLIVPNKVVSNSY
jgi:hypothetical protein